MWCHFVKADYDITDLLPHVILHHITFDRPSCQDVGCFTDWAEALTYILLRWRQLEHARIWCNTLGYLRDTNHFCTQIFQMQCHNVTWRIWFQRLKTIARQFSLFFLFLTLSLILYFRSVTIDNIQRILLMCTLTSKVGAANFQQLVFMVFSTS